MNEIGDSCRRSPLLALLVWRQSSFVYSIGLLGMQTGDDTTHTHTRMLRSVVPVFTCLWAVGGNDEYAYYFVVHGGKKKQVAPLPIYSLLTGT